MHTKEHPAAPVAPAAQDAESAGYWSAEFPPELLDLKVVEERVWTWSLSEWDTLPAQVESPRYELGGQQWLLALQPQGAEGQRNAIALFLRRADAEQSDICVQFVLVMHNPRNPRARVAHRVNKRFTPATTDWGFRNFTDLRHALMGSTEGPPLIEKGVTKVELILRQIEDPTGLLWREDFSDYDSRKHTGYVGLENQGATCYLNSLLQSLYFTVVFREAVYAIPKGDAMATSLQSLFCQLGDSPHPVSTMALTQSFGWDTVDAFTQHDVQELNRVLMDKLETSLKGSAAEGALNNIFVGQMRSYIKCVNVDFESSRTEDFWDVQLNVKGMKDVYASFDNYVEVELLNGENQYSCDFGLQDAQKGVIFEKLPPVLHLQLKRYDYDFMNDIEVKINDRYEFPLELNLDKYVDQGSAEGKGSAEGSWVYDLYGVLVHSGNLDAGHYYALLRPSKAEQWFRFDDDRVTPATMREVLDDNYGGGNYSSAYMLVYVQRERAGQVLKEPSAPPAHIQELVATQQRQEDALRKQQVERRQNLLVQVLSSQNVQGFSGLGLLSVSQKEACTLQLRRDVTLQQHLAQMEAALGIKAVSLWLVATHDFTTIQLHQITDRFLGVPAEHLMQWSTSSIPLLWVEDKPGNPETHNLVFVKRFDGGGLRLEGSQWVPKEGPEGVLGQGHTQALGQGVTSTPEVTPGTHSPLVLIESRGSLVPLSSKPSLNQPGAVFVVDTTGSPSARAQYYQELHARVTIHCYRKTDDETEEDDSGPVAVTASTRDSYAALTAKISQAVGVAPELLKIQPYTFVRHLQKWTGRDPLASDGSNIAELWQTAGEDRTLHVLYEALDRPLASQERLVQLDIYWYPASVISEVEPVAFVADEERSVGSIVDEFLGGIEQAAQGQAASQAVRLWTSPDSKQVVSVDRATLVGAMRKRPLFVAAEPTAEPGVTPLPEEVAFPAPVGTPQAPQGTPAPLTITVYHFSRELDRPHSTPYTLSLEPGLSHEALLAALQQSSGIHGKTWEKVRLAIERDGGLAELTPDLELRDGDQVSLIHPLRRKLHTQQIVIK